MKPEILFIIPSLRLGGAERSAYLLIKFLVSREYQITLITRNDDTDFYSIPESVKRIKLKSIQKSRSIFNAWKENSSYVKELKSTIKEVSPHLIISFMARNNIHTLLATSLLNIPVIVSERNYPPANPLGFPWAMLRRFIYPKAAKLVSLSRGTDSYFSWMQKKKRIVINNAVSPPENMKKFEESIDKILNRDGRNYIVAAGRLHEVKNFLLLIETFASLAEEFSLWDLLILGEGKERVLLETLIKEKNVEERVFLPGKTRSVHNIFQKCDLFCLTSKTEGMGNVILEAMQAGLPIVSVDCPTGPREILEDGKWGVLVPLNDNKNLQNALKKMMKSHEERDQYCALSKERIKAFSPELIFSLWKDLINTLIKP